MSLNSVTTDYLFGQHGKEGGQQPQFKSPDEVSCGLGDLQLCSGSVWSQGLRRQILKCDCSSFVRHFELRISPALTMESQANKEVALARQMTTCAMDFVHLD